MAQQNVTYAFSTDNGDAELFVNGSSSPYSEGTYDGAEGNPAGSVRFDITGPASSFVQKSLTTNFFNLGIPPGSTVTGISNWSADNAYQETGTNGDHWAGASLVIGASTCRYSYPNSASSGEDAWYTMPLQDTNNAMFPITNLATSVYIKLDIDVTVGSGNTADLFYDNITFDIDYTPPSTPDVVLTGDVTQTKHTVSGTMTITDVDVRLIGDIAQTKHTVSGTLALPDVFLHEGPTQTKHTVSGAMSFTDVDVRLLQRNFTQAKQIVSGGLTVDDITIMYGGSIQRKHRNYGSLYIPLTGVGVPLTPASISYQLLLDTVEFPMIRGLIKRNVNFETAMITIPSALMPAIIASSYVNLTVNMYRATLDGFGIDLVQMFTGTIDYIKTERSKDSGRLHADGAALYTTRVNREIFGEPYYVRDTGFSSAVRGPIDPEIVPGDVIKYSNVRQLQAVNVTFNIDPNYSFMEASNGY